MYVVIFRALIKQLDESYTLLAKRLRQLALEDFGCTAFHAVTEGAEEIAISYWPNQEAIARWRQAALHLEAQSAGQQLWYSAYQVDIAKIERSYSR